MEKESACAHADIGRHRLHPAGEMSDGVFAVLPLQTWSRQLGVAMTQAGTRWSPSVCSAGSGHAPSTNHRGSRGARRGEVVASTNERNPREAAPLAGAPADTRGDLLSPLELADRWGVTTGHLANLRHQGQGIGYLKIGGRVAYRLADVLAYEESVYVSVPAGNPWVDG